ncbi:MAG TPA: hypothetical protein VNK44_00055 [Candidatus Nitrosotenuis sp.]|nr:hypothetical protein [Candidatus Nitrosotenuis sp.]
MSRRYLNRVASKDESDLENPIRAVSVQTDTRNHAERVKDQIIETREDTKNADQYMKFVNAHLQHRVSTLERIKEGQRKFEAELDMFRVDPQTLGNSQNNDAATEKMVIVKELSALISRYGFEKLSEALDTILENKKTA